MITRYIIDKEQTLESKFARECTCPCIYKHTTFYTFVHNSQNLHPSKLVMPILTAQLLNTIQCSWPIASRNIPELSFFQLIRQFLVHHSAIPFTSLNIFITTTTRLYAQVVSKQPNTL